MTADWERVATEALERHQAGLAEAAKDRPSRLRRVAGWLLGPFRSTGEIGPTGWYWSVNVSDWPIDKRPEDLTPEQALAALTGLSDYYGAAMTSLANTEVPDDLEMAE